MKSEKIPDALTETKKERTAALVMTLLCSVLYFTSYVARKSFSAVKLGMLDVFTEVEMGMIASALFFAYGAGQVVSGILADRTKPQRLIYIGLVLTALCNASFTFVTAVPVLVAIWAVNGFAQALFWPPILRLLVTRVSERRYAGACATITMASSVATVVVYFLASWVISLDNFRVMFYISTGLALAVLVALAFLFPAFDRRYYTPRETPLTETTEKEAVTEKPRVSFVKFFVLSGLLFMCLSMVLCGFIRDGLDEWLPTYFKEAFALGGESATLIAVVTPIFAILFVQLSNFLYRRVFRENELLECTAFYILALVASILLSVFCTENALLSLLLLVLINGSVHGINFCLTCVAPKRFKDSGNISTVGGVINASVYIGSTVASTAISLIFTAFGWSATFLVFSAITLCGVLLCAALTYLLRKNKKM